MKLFKKGLTTVLVAAVSIGSYVAVSGLVRDVRFARAEDQVQLSRDQLKKVDDLADVYRAVGRAVEPSVVKIDVRKTVHGAHRMLQFDDDMLKRFFDRGNGNGNGNGNGGDDSAPNPPRRQRNNDQNNNDQNNGDDNGGGGGDEFQQVASGSGVIMEASDGAGYILTNNHVAGGAEEITVYLSDGRTIKHAKVLGADPKSDLAVVKIEADKLIPAQWGDSDQLQKGDIIFAFGSPFGYIGSMTHGIVSALNRQDIDMPGNQDFRYENFIQVDAPINPGNSGGPLVNLHGEVVGINTAIATETGSFSGIGFAIPSDQAKTVYGQLKNSGKVVRGFIGVGIRDVSAAPDLAKRRFDYNGTTGAIVEQIWPDTPAANKLQPGDIVTAIDGKKVTDSTQLRYMIASTQPGKTLTFNVFREGKDEDVKVKIGEQPETLAVADTDETTGDHAASGDVQSSAEANVRSLGLRLITPNSEIISRYSLKHGIKGAVVVFVDGKSAAGRAGLRPGDVITQVDRDNVESAKQAADLLSKQDLSKGIPLTITGPRGSAFVMLSEEDK